MKQSVIVEDLRTNNIHLKNHQCWKVMYQFHPLLWILTKNAAEVYYPLVRWLEKLLNDENWAWKNILSKRDKLDEECTQRTKFDGRWRAHPHCGETWLQNCVHRKCNVNSYTEINGTNYLQCLSKWKQLVRKDFRTLFYRTGVRLINFQARQCWVPP